MKVLRFGQRRGTVLSLGREGNNTKIYIYICIINFEYDLNEQSSVVQ